MVCGNKGGIFQKVRHYRAAQGSRGLAVPHQEVGRLAGVGRFPRQLLPYTVVTPHSSRQTQVHMGLLIKHLHLIAWLPVVTAVAAALAGLG